MIHDRIRNAEMTKLQEAAYGAQLAAGLPTSSLALSLLSQVGPRITTRQCTTYIHTIQRDQWFSTTFPGHVELVTVVGGGGTSRADAEEHWIKIGVDDRGSVGRCEQACLHELAHVVTRDRGPNQERREPTHGRYSSKGHHHAWRANFIQIVGNVLGKRAAQRLRSEFIQWGLPVGR